MVIQTPSLSTAFQVLTKFSFGTPFVGVESIPDEMGSQVIKVFEYRYFKVHFLLNDFCIRAFI